MEKSYPWQLRVAEYVSYMLVVLVPLVWSMHTRHPFIAVKPIVIAAGAATMTFFTGWAFITKKIEFRLTWIQAAIFLYFVALLIGGIIGIDPTNSLFGDFSRGMSIATIGFLSLIAVIIAELIRRKEAVLRRLFGISFWVGVAVSLLAFLGQHALNVGWRVIDASWNGSTIGNSSFLGAYLLLVLFMGLFCMLTVQGWKKKIPWAVGMFLAMIGPTLFNFQILAGQISFRDIIKNPVLLTGEAQGALLGIMAGMLVVGCVWLITSRNTVKRWIGGGLVLIMVITGGTLAAIAVTPTTRLYHSITEVKTESRFVYWDIAWKGFLDKPIFGWGYQNYSYVYQKHFNPLVFTVGYGRESWTDSPHNIVLEHMVNTGIVGTIAYLMLYLVALVLLGIAYYRQKTPTLRIFVAVGYGVLVGYFLQDLFVFDHPAVLFEFFMIIGAIAGVVPVCGTMSFPKIPVRVRFIESVLVVALLGVSGFLITEFVINPAREASAWMTLASDLPVEDHDAFRKKVQDMSWTGTINDSIETASGFYAPLKSALQNATGPQRVILAQEILSIMNDLDREVKRQPNSARAYYLAAKYANLLSTLTADPTERTKILERSRAYSEHAVSINPRHPYFWIEAAYTELLDGKGQAAAAFALKSFDINPADDEIYKNTLGIVQVLGNRTLIKKINDEHVAAMSHQ